jgi:hypothetical protein
MDTSTGAAINHINAKAFFPRLTTQSAAATTPDRITAARAAIKHRVIRRAAKLVNPARG